MRVLIIGGTGQVGSLVAAGLAAKGADVHVLSRDVKRAAAIPKPQVGVVGDLLDVSVLRSEMQAADAAFVMSPPTESITFAGLTVLALAKEARLQNVVMMTGQDCVIHQASGHIGSLVPLESELERSGLTYTLLNPNYFYQNDERQKSRLLGEGVYGSPIGDVGLSRCDVRDIAGAALAAFEAPGRIKRLRVCGPEILKGDSVASGWSKALGKPVRYGGHADMREFEEQMVRAGFASHWALDLRIMYESFQRHGLLATAEDVERLTAFLGRPPRSFAAYAREAAAAWLGNGP